MRLLPIVLLIILPAFVRKTFSQYAAVITLPLRKPCRLQELFDGGEVRAAKTALQRLSFATSSHF